MKNAQVGIMILELFLLAYIHYWGLHLCFCKLSTITIFTRMAIMLHIAFFL